MKIWFGLILVGLVFLSGCAKEKTTEIQFKNDVITIENYVVDNVAPYVSNEVSISFDIKNNGDKPVKLVTVNFFDIPGFDLILPTGEESKNNIGSLDCRKFGETIQDSDDERSCTFGGADPLDVIDPLDTRSIRFTLKSTSVSSPTPFTVSFSITYRYASIKQIGTNPYLFSAERTAIIPIIDPDFKKEPSSKFSQSEPTIGPIVFDIIPSLEREKIVDSKTIKEYWGVVDIPFQTKFVMKKIVSEGMMKDIPPRNQFVDCQDPKETPGCINVQLINLKPDESGRCNFYFNPTENKGTAKITVNEKNDTLVCIFEPLQQSGFTSEFTSSITIQYNYDYEIIKKQNFVIYPAIS